MRDPETCLNAQLLALVGMYDDAQDEDEYFAVGALADALGKSLSASMIFGSKRGTSKSLSAALMQFALDGIPFAFSVNESKKSTRIGFMDTIASYVRMYVKRADPSELEAMRKCIDNAERGLHNSSPSFLKELAAARELRDSDSIWESLFEFEEMLVVRKSKSKEYNPLELVKSVSENVIPATASKLPLKRLDDDDEDEDVTRNILEDTPMKTPKTRKLTRYRSPVNLCTLLAFIYLSIYIYVCVCVCTRKSISKNLSHERPCRSIHSKVDSFIDGMYDQGNSGESN